MATAREIRAKLREQERAKRKKREDAVVAVVTAGEAVTTARAAGEKRKEKLREQLAIDLAAEDAKVAGKEVAAGEAVLAAMDGELAKIGAAWREGELHELTGFTITDLRRWTRQARQSAGQQKGGEPETSQTDDAEQATQDAAEVPPQQALDADAGQAQPDPVAADATTGAGNARWPAAAAVSLPGAAGGPGSETR